LIAVNLTLEKKVRVTIGRKSRGEMRNEIGEITEMAADAPTTRYGAFGGCCYLELAY
jgi:hypothetical protein